jgi:hypothetical protein
MKLVSPACRRSISTFVVFLFVTASAAYVLAGQTGRNAPLDGDGVHPIIYYYDYSDDGITNDQLIHDRTNNTIDTVPLLNPDPFYAFLGNPPSRDDLATALVDGSSRLNEIGAPPGTPFQFTVGANQNFLLAGSRILDVAATGHGAITVTKNALTHQNISDAGGFTFETYLRRLTDTTGFANQQIWNPEGSHSLEITQSGNLLLQLRGLGADVSVPASTTLPLREWHHVMAQLRVTQPLPNGGNPQQDPLLANYRLFVDGELVGLTADIDLMSATCCILEFLDHEHGVGGSEYGASDEYFRGQLALTRLSLGTLTVEQSLYLPPEVNRGDYNNNGTVDAADYVFWRKSSGTSATIGSGADGNADGFIDPADYLYWRARFGNSVNGGGTSAHVVFGVIPEPTISVLFLFCAGWLAFQRIRRNNWICTID